MKLLLHNTSDLCTFIYLTIAYFPVLLDKLISMVEIFIYRHKNAGERNLLTNK